MEAATRLTADVEAYRRDGYVRVDGAFGGDELSALRAECDRLAEFGVDVALALREPHPRLDVQRRDGHLVLRKIQPLADVSPVFAAVAADARVQGLAEALVGARVALMEEKLNYKQRLPDAPDLDAGDEGETFPFHTDFHYFYLDGYPPETLSVAVAVDDAGPENGCLRVVPGSHTRDDWPLRGGWPPILADGAVDDEELVDLVMPAGSVAVFDSRLVHASQENHSPLPRRLLILSYFPAGHPVDPDRRNRPLREAAQAAEARYAALVESGAWQPTYRIS